MTVTSAEKPDDIWHGDLFDRQAEAAMLIGYIESLAESNLLREDARSYNIAIDAGYGVGKTFFLSRLARHLRVNHPVAYVDAWVDDLADEPFTALAATLKRALDPLIETVPEVKSRWNKVAEKSGKVAVIVAKGLAKKAVSLAIGGAAVEAAGEVISGVSEATTDALTDGLKDIGKEAFEGAEKAFESVVPGKLMEQRIADFEEGQSAVKELKVSLSALIAELNETTLRSPIVIIIDELDRCRPTYAVKLLEEIKHLFDVPGLVFLFGMHGDQLARSVAGAYGPAFDGAAYLRRFISRRYMLAAPDLTPLVALLLKQAALSPSKLEFPHVMSSTGRFSAEHPEALIAEYMKIYGLSARDAFQVVDILQTAAALTKNTPLIMPYLLPLIVGFIKGLPAGQLPEAEAGAPDITFVVAGHVSYRNENLQVMNIKDLAVAIEAASRQTQNDLMNRINVEGGDAIAMMVLNPTFNNNSASNPLSDPKKYPKLIEQVGRFSDPLVEGLR